MPFPTRHLALSSLAALALAASACGKGAAPAARTRPPPLVTTAKVEVRDVPVLVRAPVDLHPIASADVGSKTLGWLDAVLVDRGDKVHKGQVLALVRPSDLPDQLAAARGTLAQAEASLALARTNAERTERLSPSGVVSEQELAQARAALAQTEAAASAVRSQVAGLGVRLGETRIESPLAGVVSTRRLDPGALVGPPGGGAIVTVVRTDVLRAFVAVTERDAGAVAVGQPARVELDAFPGRTFEGRVRRIAPSFDTATRTLDAEVELDNAALELRPGMYGRASIETARHPHMPVIPIAALQISGGERYVFVVDGDRARRRRIATGVDEGSWLEVATGLAGGETIVTGGADGLGDGVAVRVAGASSATPAGSAPPAGSAAPSTDRK